MERLEYNQIFNDGERLIPGESHDLAETVRHKSSYRFFKAVIEADLARGSEAPIRILDLGCGVGHGAHMLAELPGVEVVGIDPSAESIRYASQNYCRDNIAYIHSDAEQFIGQGMSFDYIVSRHALEHIENGLEIALKFRCRRRLMVNVPYKEPEGNIHHKVHFIDENSFVGYEGAEFFFEDLLGVTATNPDKLAFTNSIIAILTRNGASKVEELLNLPFAAWQPSLQERIAIENSSTLQQLEIRVSQLEKSLDLALSKIEQLVRQEAQLAAKLESIQSSLIYRILRKLRLMPR